MNWIKPKHTAAKIARELAEGLKNGTIALDENPEELEHQLAVSQRSPFFPMVFGELSRCSVFSLSRQGEKQALIRDVQGHLESARERFWVLSGDIGEMRLERTVLSAISNGYSNICQNRMMDTRVILSQKYDLEEGSPFLMGCEAPRSLVFDSWRGFDSSGGKKQSYDCVRSLTIQVRFWVLLIDDVAYCRFSKSPINELQGAFFGLPEKGWESSVFKVSGNLESFKACKQFIDALWHDDLRTTSVRISGDF